MYHSTNRIMVGTSRDRDISQYKQNHGWNFKDRDVSQEKQNHGWNFKRQGYITVQTESWLELQETDISQYKQNHGWNFKRQGVYRRNRIMVGTSRDRDISQ